MIPSRSLNNGSTCVQRHSAIPVHTLVTNPSTRTRTNTRRNHLSISITHSSQHPDHAPISAPRLRTHLSTPITHPLSTRTTHPSAPGAQAGRLGAAPSPHPAHPAPAGRSIAAPSAGCPSAALQVWASLAGRRGVAPSDSHASGGQVSAQRPVWEPGRLLGPVRSARSTPGAASGRPSNAPADPSGDQSLPPRTQGRTGLQHTRARGAARYTDRITGRRAGVSASASRLHRTQIAPRSLEPVERAQVSAHLRRVHSPCRDGVHGVIGGQTWCAC